MRVIAGEAGSVPLIGPPSGVRPTTERVREVFFSSLADRVTDRPFVDLYAGSGAMGIEALSRGASCCLFVEQRAACVKVIRENLAKTGLADCGEVWHQDVAKVLGRVVSWLHGEAGIVFADPPYAYKLAGKVISQLITAELPAGTIVVVEHSAREAHSALPVPTWRRKIGETYLSRWEA